jgi:hypothetical protein
MIMDTAIKRLSYLCLTIPPLLLAIDEEIFSAKPSPGKWSKKQIIGHLIDSAANNHQRFVRVQFEDKPAISYDQNKWNEFNFYQQIDGKQIIKLWAAYNLQLTELIKHIPAQHLQRECLSGDKLLTLEFLINDYADHLEHHLRQVVDYL